MHQGIRKIIQKCFLLPQRYVLAIMGFLALTNAFQLRVCLNIAITEMVVPHSNNIYSPSYDPDACPDDIKGSSDNDTSLNNVTDGDLFDWDEETQGLILSSFFWGYIITQIPGGLLADKFGGKHILGIGILGSSMLTILIPIAAKTGIGWLLALLVIKGMGEGTTFPAINALLARWIPLQERGLLGSLVFAGSEVGTVTGTLFSGYLLHTFKGDWPLVFYVFGGIGILWCVLWTLLCYSEPDKHPFITDEEKLFLRETLGNRRPSTPPPPWPSILKSFPLWAVICSQFGRDWAFFTMLTDLPKYMKDVLKFSIAANGVLSSLPYMALWLVSLAAGCIADQTIKKKWLSVTTTRKLLTSISHIGSPLGLIAASYAGCDRTLVVILFTVAMGLNGTFYAGMEVNVLDLSPNYAATLMAVVNGIGCVSGIIAPYVAGVLTPNQTLMEWRSVFWITVVINMISLVIVLWGASGEIQPWNSKTKNVTDGEKKNSQKKDSTFKTSDHGP